MSTTGSSYSGGWLNLCLLLSLASAAAALNANFFGMPYVKPYGPMDFPAPTATPDLPPASPVLPVSATKLQKGQKDCTFLIHQVKRLINSATHPNPEIWFNGGNTENNTLAKSLFNKNINLRISPLGIFPGFKFAVQYYYALPYFWFPIQSSYVDHLTCVGNTVSYRLTMTMLRPEGKNTSQWNIVQFDNEGKIKTLDAIFYNLGALYDNMIDTPAGYIPTINTDTNQTLSYVLLNGTEVSYPPGTYTYNFQNTYMICQISALGYSQFSANPTNIPGEFWGRGGGPHVRCLSNACKRHC